MRRAISLIEVLAFILGVGVLAALILPALLRSRGYYHRVTCQSHLRSLGLAINGHLIRKGAFPASTTAGTNHSWTAAILDDLDEVSLLNAYNFDVADYDPANRTVVGIGLATLVCPDNPLSRDPRPSQMVVRPDGTRYPPGSAFAPSHFGANWGGGRLPGYGDDFARTQGNHRGVMTDIEKTGRIGPKDVVDGLATTILLGERRDGQGWAVGGYGGSEFDVATSPFLADRPYVRTVVTGSFHPSGLNFAFADGSVRYIDGTIARQVWYALITRDGREAVKADTY